MGVETVILAAAATYGAISGQDQARRANKEKADAKKVVKAREAELAAEAAGKEAAKKKAETAGQRAGFGTSGEGVSFRSAFTSSAAGGTGFKNVAEDNIRRGTLFGN